MRPAALLLLALVLGACERHEPDAEAGASRAAKATGMERVACKLAGAAAFSDDCTVERVRRGDVETLVVHHPGGSFRRFDVLENGRGLAVADGATQAVTRYADGFAELAVDGDSYRFPITVKGLPSNAAPR